MFSLSGKEQGARGGKAGASLSFIGAEAEVSGDLVTASHLHIDGKVTGDVSCAALVVGKSGTISGNVAAEEATIAGLVEGAIDVGTLVLEASARVTGELRYDSIAIAAGAQVEGRFTRRNAAAAEAPPKREERPVQPLPSLFPGAAEAAE